MTEQNIPIDYIGGTSQGAHSIHCISLQPSVFPASVQALLALTLTRVVVVRLVYERHLRAVADVPQGGHAAAHGTSLIAV